MFEYKELVQNVYISPNSDIRCLTPSLIVLHKIALPLQNPSLKTVSDFFCNRLEYHQSSFLSSLANVKVSSHFVIDFDGTLIQFVEPETRVAWHCGLSQYAGVKKCNDFSIGIEFLGYDWTDLTNLQYTKGNKLIKALCNDFRILPTHVVGHKDISPARKTDPGFYNKDRLLV